MRRFIQVCPERENADPRSEHHLDGAKATTYITVAMPPARLAIAAALVSLGAGVAQLWSGHRPASEASTWIFDGPRMLLGASALLTWVLAWRLLDGWQRGSVRWRQGAVVFVLVLVQGVVVAQADEAQRDAVLHGVTSSGLAEAWLSLALFLGVLVLVGAGWLGRTAPRLPAWGLWSAQLLQVATVADRARDLPGWQTVAAGVAVGSWLALAGVFLGLIVRLRRARTPRGVSSPEAGAAVLLSALCLESFPPVGLNPPEKVAPLSWMRSGGEG